MNNFRVGQIDPGKSSIKRWCDIPYDLLGSVHIMGSSGEGKSELEIRLAEYTAGCGDGVLVIDPHGDMAKQLVATTAHTDRVIYCNPTMQLKTRWVFNPLEFDSAFKGRPEFSAYSDHVAGSIIALFAHLGRSDPSFTLVINYLKGAVALALAEERPTLAHATLALYSDSYKDHLLTDKNKDFWSKLFWFDFEQWTDQAERSQLNSTKFRLIDLFKSTFLYNLIGHYKSSVRLADWLNAGKIVVWDLSGLNEDIAEVYGGLLVSRVIAEYRLRGAELVAEGEHSWRIIADEFHNFSPDPYEQLTTAGRKRGVFPVMAHQTMGQLWRYGRKGEGEPALVSAVKGARIQVRFFTDEQEESDRELEIHQASVYYRGIREKRAVTVQLQPYGRELSKEVIAERVRKQAEISAELATPLADLPSLEKQFGSWLELDRLEKAKRPRNGTTPTDTKKKAPPPHQGVLPTGHVPAQPNPGVATRPADAGLAAGTDGVAAREVDLSRPVESQTGRIQSVKRPKRGE